MNKYIFTKAQNEEELQQLVRLYNQVFHPEKVGELADVLTHHLPYMKYQNWYISKEKTTNEIVSGFALIPWQWNMQGIDLKVAEMGIVGTKELHRGKGLFKQTNQIFNDDLISNKYDLCVIQGIPGIYHRLGYHYALALEHHTELPLYAIPDSPLPLNIRKVNEGDIPFMIKEEEQQGNQLDIRVQRTQEHWHYLLHKSKETEYGSEFYLIQSAEKYYYIRLLVTGFGQGLIVSEASSEMPIMVLEQVLSFLKEEANKRNKPYIRLNLPNSHCIVTHALNYEARLKPAYAWQIKIIDNKRFIGKLRSLFEKRIKSSKFIEMTANIMLDFYTSQIILSLKNGKIQSITSEPLESTDYVMSIPDDLFAALALGHRSWCELQYNRPDIFPADQYLRTCSTQPAEVTGELMDILFPKLNNWIYCQY